MQDRIKINIFGIKLTVKNPFLVNNKILLTKNGVSKQIYFVRGLKVKFYGSNNKIEFWDKVPKMKNVRIDCGSNSRISIKQTPYRLKNLYINARAENVQVNIDEDFSIESGKFDFHGEPNININIGKDCQLGSNIQIDPADGHTIFDETSEYMLNSPKDININSHVWLCENVSLLKGVNIPSNCIVAKGSIVTRTFSETNKVIAGVPATIIQSEKYSFVNWSRCSNKNFKAKIEKHVCN